MLVNVLQLTHQGSSVLEICQKINSWAESCEIKWQYVPTKYEEKIPVHHEGNTMSLHRPRLMDVGEVKISSKGCVVKCIENQWCNKENNNGIREYGGVCSPMSMISLQCV